MTKYQQIKSAHVQVAQVLLYNVQDAFVLVRYFRLLFLLIKLTWPYLQLCWHSFADLFNNVKGTGDWTTRLCEAVAYTLLKLCPNEIQVGETALLTRPPNFLFSATIMFEEGGLGFQTRRSEAFKPKKQLAILNYRFSVYHA